MFIFFVKINLKVSLFTFNSSTCYKTINPFSPFQPSFPHLNQFFKLLWLDCLPSLTLSLLSWYVYKKKSVPHNISSTWKSLTFFANFTKTIMLTSCFKHYNPHLTMKKMLLQLKTYCCCKGNWIKIILLHQFMTHTAMCSNMYCLTTATTCWTN